MKEGTVVCFVFLLLLATSGMAAAQALRVDGGTGVTAIYGQISGSATQAVYGKALTTGTGVRGEGLTGVWGRSFDTPGGNNYGVEGDAGCTGCNSATAVQAVVRRNGTGDFWSGDFYDLGTDGVYHGLYADYRTGSAIDVAEYINDTAGDTKPGDVVVADRQNDESVVKSSEPYDTSVLGVISTRPHMVLGIELVMDEETRVRYEDITATQLTIAGRIPVKVTDENGPIERGDLLTSSSKPGYAMKWSSLDTAEAMDFEELKWILAENTRRGHALLGKALTPHDSGEGTIIALLSLQ